MCCLIRGLFASHAEQENIVPQVNVQAVQGGNVTDEEVIDLNNPPQVACVEKGLKCARATFFGACGVGSMVLGGLWLLTGALPAAGFGALIGLVVGGCKGGAAGSEVGNQHDAAVLAAPLFGGLLGGGFGAAAGAAIGGLGFFILAAMAFEKAKS